MDISAEMQTCLAIITNMWLSHLVVRDICNGGRIFYSLSINFIVHNDISTPKQQTKLGLY